MSSSFTKIFLLFAIVFSACLIPSHAGPIPFLAVNEPTECLVGGFDIFATDSDASLIFGPVVPNYNDVDYFNTTSVSFNSGSAYFNVTMLNHRNTTILYDVNSGPSTIAIYPEDLGLFPISGLIPQGGGCQPIVNIVHVRITQLDAYNQGRERNCSYDYYFHITSAPSSACGDPQFVGLRGQSFQIHGIDGAVYNLISAKEYAVNSLFEFLSGPRACPIMPSTGRKSAACWSHEGSYLANLGISTVSGDKILIQSGNGANGFASVTVNSRSLLVSESVEFSQGSVMYNSTHEATLHVGAFYIEVENVDGFINLRRVRVEKDTTTLAMDGGIHGLLGQTWRNKRYSGKIAEIEGEPDDYVVEDIFSSDFPYSRMVMQS